MFKTIVTSPFKKTACGMYPFKPTKLYDNTRGHISLDASKCFLCTFCAKRCPTGAIVVDRVKGSWQINRFKCILCNECVICCKPGALSMANQYTTPAAKMELETYQIEIKKPKTNEPTT